MVSDDNTRTSLKAELLRQLQALTLQQALFPQKGESINKLVYQLEGFNPTPQPLQSHNLPSLLGNWQLIYASSGTVVTRQIASLPNPLWEVVNIKQVWQRLALDSSGNILTENGALLKLALLGEWQILAKGIWKVEDELVAKVSFNAFSFGAINLFSQPNWSLPSLEIPVWELLRNEAMWTTSYLDSNLRIGRGGTGNMFVFRRQS